MPRLHPVPPCRTDRRPGSDAAAGRTRAGLVPARPAAGLPRDRPHRPICDGRPAAVPRLAGRRGRGDGGHGDGGRPGPGLRGTQDLAGQLPRHARDRPVGRRRDPVPGRHRTDAAPGGPSLCRGDRGDRSDARRPAQSHQRIAGLSFCQAPQCAGNGRGGAAGGRCRPGSDPCAAAVRKPDRRSADRGGAAGCAVLGAGGPARQSNGAECGDPAGDPAAGVAGRCPFGAAGAAFRGPPSGAAGRAARRCGQPAPADDAALRADLPRPAAARRRTGTGGGGLLRRYADRAGVLPQVSGQPRAGMPRHLAGRCRGSRRAGADLLRFGRSQWRGAGRSADGGCRTARGRRL